MTYLTLTLIDPTEQAFNFAFAGRSIGTAVAQVRAEFGAHPGQVMGGIDAPIVTMDHVRNPVANDRPFQHFFEAGPILLKEKSAADHVARGIINKGDQIDFLAPPGAAETSPPEARPPRRRPPLSENDRSRCCA